MEHHIQTNNLALKSLNERTFVVEHHIKKTNKKDGKSKMVARHAGGSFEVKMLQNKLMSDGSKPQEFSMSADSGGGGVGDRTIILKYATALILVSNSFIEVHEVASSI